MPFLTSLGSGRRPWPRTGDKGHRGSAGRREREDVPKGRGTPRPTRRRTTSTAGAAASGRPRAVTSSGYTRSRRAGRRRSPAYVVTGTRRLSPAGTPPMTGRPPVAPIPHTLRGRVAERGGGCREGPAPVAARCRAYGRVRRVVAGARGRQDGRDHRRVHAPRPQVRRKAGDPWRGYLN